MQRSTDRSNHSEADIKMRRVMTWLASTAAKHWNTFETYTLASSAEKQMALHFVQNTSKLPDKATDKLLKANCNGRMERIHSSIHLIHLAFSVGGRTFWVWAEAFCPPGTTSFGMLPGKRQNFVASENSVCMRAEAFCRPGRILPGYWQTFCRPHWHW